MDERTGGLSDRHQREFCFGPTHEEVITDMVRHDVRSYKQLPLNFYQIQVKFRDEIRPRFGVMRAREFLMKDAYSFHIDQASLEETYQVMYQTYSRIFSRLGLDFRAVQADTGSIGGNASHEFHVLADSGEDAIAFEENGAIAVGSDGRIAWSGPLEQLPPDYRQAERIDHGDSNSVLHRVGGVEELELCGDRCLKSRRHAVDSYERSVAHEVRDIGSDSH